MWSMQCAYMKCTCRDNCRGDYWVCGACKLSTISIYREPLHGVLGQYPTEGELGYGEPLADRLAKVRVPPDNRSIMRKLQLLLPRAGQF
jgi:hypothetical protein